MMENQPRVLLVLASSGWGGTEKAFVELANALAERCHVWVAVPPDAVLLGRLTSRVAGIRMLRRGSRRNPLVLRHLAGLIGEIDPDVVHTHAARATEMVYWVSRFRRVRQVATKHNARSRRIFSRIPWVTAVSKAARATIDHAGSVEVVYNGVDIDCEARATRPDVFTILAVGRLHHYKGFDVLVRETAVLPFEHVVEIAGEGPERPKLEALTRTLGVEGRVILLGHREDVARLMARAHVTVVPSRTEGFSLALVEALTCSDVVISTRVGIAEEVLPEALLVNHGEIAERLVDVHTRHSEFASLTAAARAAVGDRFRLAHAVDRYLDVYQRAIQG